MPDAGHTAQQGHPEQLGDWLLPPAAFLEGLPDAVVASARDGRIVFANALAEQLFGYSPGELVGQPVAQLWPERLRARYTRNMELYFETDHPLRFSTEAWGLRRDGSEFMGEMSWGIMETTAGPLLLAIGRDISDQRAAEARLRALAAIGEHALSGADPRELATEAVEALRTMLPTGGAQLLLADGSVLASYGTCGDTAVRLAIGAGEELRLMPQHELREDELSFLRAMGSTLATALARLRDEQRIRHEALHDPLTGLPNRTLLRDRLEHALAHSWRTGRATGVLFIDLDYFKQVNDTHGHATGDAVLIEVGGRLVGAVRPSDTVARLGGDEFVVVCEGVDERLVLVVGGRLHAAVCSPLALDGVEHLLSASIGVALGLDDPDALLDRADTAVYRAKAAGRRRIELYEAG